MAESASVKEEDVCDFDKIVMSESTIYDEAFQAGLKAGKEETAANAFSTARKVACKGSSTLGYYYGLCKNLLPELIAKEDKTEEDDHFKSVIEKILALTETKIEDQKQVEDIVKNIHTKIEAARTHKLLKNKSHIWDLMRKYDGTAKKPDFEF